MIKRMKRVYNRKGITMIELMVSMIVLSIVMIAVTAVLMPMYRNYQKANNLAEINIILDTLSALVMNDIAGAISIDPPSGSTESGAALRINASFDIIYTVMVMNTDNGNSILMRSARGGEAQALLEEEFYKNNSISAKWTVEDGLVEITLKLTSAEGEWERTYKARPVGLEQRVT